MSDQFEERLSAVEQRVQLEAGLRAKVDKDVSDLESGQRGLVRVIHAVRKTQVEHGHAIGRIERVLAGHDSLLNLHTAQLERLETRMDRLETRMDRLETRMDGLETRFDGLEVSVSGISRKIDRVLELLEPPPAATAAVN